MSKKNLRKSVNMVGADDWQSDPMILDSYTKVNSGYKYLLIEIVRKLKTKTASDMR
jgi:hypothetical protein